MHPEIQHLVEILPEPSFLLTAAGRIVFGNTAASQLLGLQKSALEGKTLQSVAQNSADKVESYLRVCSRQPAIHAWSAGGSHSRRAGSGSAAATERSWSREPIPTRA